MWRKLNTNKAKYVRRNIAMVAVSIEKEQIIVSNNKQEKEQKYRNGETCSFLCIQGGAISGFFLTQNCCNFLALLRYLLYFLLGGITSSLSY